MDYRTMFFSCLTRAAQQSLGWRSGIIVQYCDHFSLNRGDDVEIAEAASSREHSGAREKSLTVLMIYMSSDDHYLVSFLIPLSLIKTKSKKRKKIDILTHIFAPFTYCAWCLWHMLIFFHPCHQAASFRPHRYNLPGTKVGVERRGVRKKKKNIIEICMHSDSECNLNSVTDTL